MFSDRYRERVGSGWKDFHGKNVGREATLLCDDKTSLQSENPLEERHFKPYK